MVHREHLFAAGQEYYDGNTGVQDVNLARIASGSDNPSEKVCSFMVVRGKLVAGVFEAHLAPINVAYVNRGGGALSSIQGDGLTPNTVTVTATSHGLATGYRIDVTGTTNYNGADLQVTVVDQDTFTYQTSLHTQSGQEMAGTIAGKNYDHLMGDAAKTRVQIEDQIYQDLVLTGKVNPGTQQDVV